jgi:hypothetical protein
MSNFIMQVGNQFSSIFVSWKRNPLFLLSKRALAGQSRDKKEPERQKPLRLFWRTGRDKF